MALKNRVHLTIITDLVEKNINKRQQQRTSVEFEWNCEMNCYSLSNWN